MHILWQTNNNIRAKQEKNNYVGETGDDCNKNEFFFILTQNLLKLKQTKDDQRIVDDPGCNLKKFVCKKFFCLEAAADLKWTSFSYI